MKEKLKEARELKEKLGELGAEENPDDWGLLVFLEMRELRSEFREICSQTRNINGKLSWLLGAAAVAIGILTAVAIAVF